MVKRIQLTDDVFNPDVILASGQVFRMKREGDIYSCLSGENEIQFYRVSADTYEFFCEDSQWDFWWKYFDLDCDYSAYNEAVIKSGDPFLKKALMVGQGMRILRQDVWETFISYIVSQNNNIPKIKKSLNILCERYSDGYKFPSAEVLSEVSVEELSEGTALGYRAEYISEFSRAVANGDILLSDFENLGYEEAINKLLEIKGIGPKVANCIALYGLHLMEGYPIDTWMKKIIKEDYSSLSQSDYLSWLHDNFKGFEGYVQQLQFYCKRR